jgi:hypothetical protein
MVIHDLRNPTNQVEYLVNQSVKKLKVLQGRFQKLRQLAEQTREQSRPSSSSWLPVEMPSIHVINESPDQAIKRSLNSMVDQLDQIDTNKNKFFTKINSMGPVKGHHTIPLSNYIKRKASAEILDEPSITGDHLSKKEEYLLKYNGFMKPYTLDKEFRNQRA